MRFAPKGLAFWRDYPRCVVLDAEKPGIYLVVSCVLGKGWVIFLRNFKKNNESRSQFYEKRNCLQMIKLGQGIAC